MENNLSKKCYSFSEKIMYIIFTAAMAVILPQLLHTVGILTGTNAALGQILLPMHIPVMILGFCIGPWAGFTAGILAPVISHFLTAMPASALLPYIAAEVSAYGFFAGFIKDTKLNPICKIVSVQVLGRLIRVLTAILFSVILGNSTAAFGAACASIMSGIPGIILQIILVPYIVNRIGRAR